MEKEVFSINLSTYLEFVSSDSLQTIHCCTEGEVWLYVNSQKTLLSVDFLKENLSIFQNQLSKALANELMLHSSIDSDIGYLYNQELQNIPGLTYTKLDQREYWVGNSYLLWNFEYASWLYNDACKGIVFKVTSIFPGNFSYQAHTTAEYQRWISNYRPFFHAVIPRKVAANWVVQIEKILQCGSESGQ